MTRTAAQDSVLRLAAGMLAADVRFTLPTEFRQWIIVRLQDHTTPLTDAERTGLSDPLLTYIAAYHPRILDVVAKQFVEDGAAEGPQGRQPQRPSTHYGLVPERT